jgi:hypothetical protein
MVDVLSSLIRLYKLSVYYHEKRKSATRNSLATPLIKNARRFAGVQNKKLLNENCVS